MFKRPMIILISVAVSVSWLCSSAHAGNIAYNDKIKPKVTLSEALDLAGKALGKDTKSFYCVGASLERVVKDCWIIKYSSASGAKRDVEVDFDKHVSSPPDAYKVRL